MTLCAWVRYFEGIVSLRTQSLSASTSNIVLFTLLRAISYYSLSTVRRNPPFGSTSCWREGSTIILVIARARRTKVTQGYDSIFFWVFARERTVFFGYFTCIRKSPLRSSREPECLSSSFLFSTSTHEDHGSHKSDDKKLPICYSLREDSLEFSTSFLALRNPS